MGGSRGIKYQYRTRVENRSDDDWMSFIQEKSEGFTKTGQLLLQEAVESYVYAVLGSQARTRFEIVGTGAKSLQMQQIFHTIVRDTAAQDDDSVLIANMRKAIKSTNVVLDMTIIPEVVLIPSSMVILNKPVPGYNNVLTTATREMAFGRNDKVNFEGFIKKKKKAIRKKEPEKFSHTLTMRERFEGEEESKDNDKTPTNARPPSLVLPKKKEEEVELLSPKKDDHWEGLTSTFLFVLGGVVLGSSYLQSSNKWKDKYRTRKNKYHARTHARKNKDLVKDLMCSHKRTCES